MKAGNGYVDKKRQQYRLSKKKENKLGIDKKQRPYLQFNSNSYIIGLLKGDL